jgi:hypothetical protein
MNNRKFSLVGLLALVAVIAVVAVMCLGATDPRSYWPVQFWKSNNGSEIGRITEDGNLQIAGRISATNGFTIHTNNPVNWPTAPTVPGNAYLGNSNGVIYLLSASPSNLSVWGATNKLGP